MSKEISPNYNQKFILPPSIEEWVADNHPVRFIKDFADALDLEELGIVRNESSPGRPAYSRGMLLAVWLYGYYSNIRSARLLEKACRDIMPFIWLTGNKPPDHNTLWRFFNRYREKLEGIFRKSVSTAVESNLVGMVLNAVDGTKLSARGSKEKAHRRDRLEELLNRTEEFIKEYGEDVERAKEEDIEGDWMPKELTDAKERALRIREALKKLDEAGRNCITPKEPSARLMKDKEGYKIGYNGQVMADDKEGIIVAQRLVNEENDLKELVPMLDKTKEVVGGVAEETLADSGYSAGEQIKTAEERGYNVLLSPKDANGMAKEKGEFSKENFKYDKERDEVICPTGKILRYERTEKIKQEGEERRIYRCKDFRECPYRDKCSKDKGGRAIKLYKHHAAMERQKEKQKEERSKGLLKLRAKIVEPVFAQIKWIMGFVRFTVFGLAKAEIQWSLVCAAYNLRKLYKHWLKRELVFS